MTCWVSFWIPMWEEPVNLSAQTYSHTHSQVLIIVGWLSAYVCASVFWPKKSCRRKTSRYHTLIYVTWSPSPNVRSHVNHVSRSCQSNIARTCNSSTNPWSPPTSRSRRFVLLPPINIVSEMSWCFQKQNWTWHFLCYFLNRRRQNQIHSWCCRTRDIDDQLEQRMLAGPDKEAI